jgi:hypothetical protein
MRLSILFLCAVFCGNLPAQQPQLFGPPKSDARFKSPSFAETFGAPAPALLPPPTLKPRPTLKPLAVLKPLTVPKTCAIPLLSAATKNNVDYVIHRVAPKENVDPQMQVANGIPACGAPFDSSAETTLKAPTGSK